jgi:glycosyltransferase involved in cell wall biosynthesis
MGLKNLQKKPIPPEDKLPQPTPKSQVIQHGKQKTAQQSICFYGGQEFVIGLRFYTPAQILSRQGIKTKFTGEVDPQDLNIYDTFVFQRPQLQQEWTKAFFAAVNAGKRVIIDIDEDFYSMPKDHAGYAQLGAGNPNNLKNLERMLAQADLVTASSKVLVERYRKYTRHIEYLPTTWDSSIVGWNRPAPKHDTFNIGWCDYASEIHNLNLLKRDVARFIKETDNALLVIGGDLRAVETFNSLLPEEKIFFIPFVGYDEYPFLLAHFDVLLSPLRDSHFNKARPDTRLMEAGARKIPWIASRIPAYEEWREGGVFAENSESWYDILKSMHQKSTLLPEMGRAGNIKAKERDQLFWTIWKNIFS